MWTVSDRAKVTDVLHSSKSASVFTAQTPPAAPRSQGGNPSGKPFVENFGRNQAGQLLGY
jgi:hypothetical protein